ncbi:hypothetical protein AB0N05_11340 [Nocardia sp. NPDC051030]|uniref:hypothetical protein n=1 Tax=Nocardia sp. NPDC051030 TaxID=3155162 RepID=UPI003436E0EE
MSSTVKHAETSDRVVRIGWVLFGLCMGGFVLVTYARFSDLTLLESLTAHTVVTVVTGVLAVAVAALSGYLAWGAKMTRFPAGVVSLAAALSILWQPVKLYCIRFRPPLRYENGVLLNRRDAVFNYPLAAAYALDWLLWLLCALAGAVVCYLLARPRRGVR